MNLLNQKSRFLFTTIIILASFLTIFFTAQQAEAANPYIQNVSFGQDEQGDYISFDWVGIPPNQQEGGWFGCMRDMILVWFNRFNPNGTTEGIRLPPEGMSNYPTGDFIPRNAFYSGGGYSGFGNYAFASGLPDYSCATNDPNLSEKLPAHIKTYINPNWSPERLSFSGEDFITIQLVGYKMNLGYAELLVHDPEEYRYQVPANLLPVIPYTNVSFGFDENDLLKISFDWIGPSRDILPLVGFNGKIHYPFYAHFDPDSEKDVSMNWESGHNQNLYNVSWFTWPGLTAQKGEHYDLFVQELHKWTPSNELRVCNWFYPCPVNRTLTEAVLGRSFNLDDYITIAFHSSGYVLNDPSKYYFGQQNNSPILSYSQDAGYIDDGINPDEGDINTNFTFKIIYTDADNDSPTDIRTIVFDGSLSDAPAIEIFSNAMILDSSASPELRDGNYINGEQYTVAKSFSADTYRYRFQASDGKTGTILDGIAGGKEQRFKVIENQPPIASFTFQPSNPKVGDRITFDASGSYDLDGTIVLYGWDWESDGLTDAYTDTSSIQYDGFLAGISTVTLYVSDNKGAVDSISAVVSVEPANQSTASISVAFCSAFGGWWCGAEAYQNEKDIKTIDEWLRDKDGDNIADANTKPFYWLKGTKCAGAGTATKQEGCLISALNTQFKDDSRHDSGLTYKAYVLSVIAEQEMVEGALKRLTPGVYPYKAFAKALLKWLPFANVGSALYNDITSKGIEDFLIASTPIIGNSTADFFIFGSSIVSLGLNAKKINETFDDINDERYLMALGGYFRHRILGSDHPTAWMQTSCGNNDENDNETWWEQWFLTTTINECGPETLLRSQMSPEMLDETEKKFEEWYEKYNIKNFKNAELLGNTFKQGLKNDIKALILFAVKNK